MDARRTLIADAALAVIGDRGIKGLTHLAVDAQAGLAKGSTSYYCRRRIDLMRLTLERLYDLDRADIAETSERLTAAAPGHGTVVREVAALVVRWLSEPDRLRTIARFELFLAASHEPELQAVLHEQMAGIRALVDSVSGATDPPGEPERALATLMLAEGLMLANVRQGLPTPSQADVERIMATLRPGPH